MEISLCAALTTKSRSTWIFVDFLVDNFHMFIVPSKYFLTQTLVLCILKCYVLPWCVFCAQLQINVLCKMSQYKFTLNSWHV